MNIQICATVILLLCAISACSPKPEAPKQTDDALIRPIVINNLKDPESARFGIITVIEGSFACATVNAKNSLGGYTGDQQAILTKLISGGWRLDEIRNFSHGDCIRLQNIKLKALRENKPR